MAYRKKRTMYRKRRITPQRKVVKKAIYRAKKQIFAKRIKSVVNTMSETKMVNVNTNNAWVTAWNSNTFSNLNIRTLCPSTLATNGTYFVGQGIGQGQREGNKITTRKLEFSGVVHINTAYDGTTNYNMCPIYLVFYFFKLKPGLDDTAANVLSVMQNSFFQTGSTSQGFTGTLVDLVRPVNSNQVTLLKKRVFKVGTQYVYSAFAAASANNANQQYSDGTVGISRMFKMDLTKIVPKIFQFNDAANTCTQRNLWMAWVPFRVDGNLIKNNADNQNATIPAFVDYQIQYSFKDL